MRLFLALAIGALALLAALPMLADSSTSASLSARFSNSNPEVGDEVTVEGKLTNPTELRASGKICADNLSTWLKARSYSRCQSFTVAARGSTTIRFKYQVVRPTTTKATSSQVRVRLQTSQSTLKLTATARARASVKLSGRLETTLSPSRVALGASQSLSLRVYNTGKWPWRGTICDTYTKSPRDPALRLIEGSECKTIEVKAKNYALVKLRFRAVGTKAGTVWHDLKLNADGQLLASKRLSVSVYEAG